MFCKMLPFPVVANFVKSCRIPLKIVQGPSSLHLLLNHQLIGQIIHLKIFHPPTNKENYISAIVINFSLMFIDNTA